MSWRIIDLQDYNPYMNMAIDEAILDSVSKGKADKTIRFYSNSENFGKYDGQVVRPIAERWKQQNLPSHELILE